MSRKRILHITPHVGGGVGRVLLSYLAHVRNDRGFEHHIVCLDYANAQAMAVAQRDGIQMIDRMAGHEARLLPMIADADIVLIHWWNHPLLYDLLVRFDLPPSRVIMWSHISGFHPPYIFTEKALEYPDLFVFTTPVSYETSDIQNTSEKVRQKLRAVWSTAGIAHVREVKPEAHSGFNVGYIGTVDYCKMHPEFLTICDRINIPDVKFIVCGGPRDEEIYREAEARGISEKFDFTGLVASITEYLSLFDLFGYPLAAHHYGTCDQVLVESMAAGIVPVVLANKMESYMIRDGKTGIVARDIGVYVDAIRYLYDNPDIRSAMSRNAIQYASQTFSIDKMVSDWEKNFEEVICFPKTLKKWPMAKKTDITATDVFLEALGDYGADFRLYLTARRKEDRGRAVQGIIRLAASPLWQAATRGTVYHYREFFGDDPYLHEWSEIMMKYQPVEKLGKRCQAIQ